MSCGLVVNLPLIMAIRHKQLNFWRICFLCFILKMDFRAYFSAILNIQYPFARSSSETNFKQTCFWVFDIRKYTIKYNQVIFTTWAGILLYSSWICMQNYFYEIYIDVIKMCSKAFIEFSILFYMYSWLFCRYQKFFKNYCSWKKPTWTQNAICISKRTYRTSLLFLMLLFVQFLYYSIYRRLWHSYVI